MLVTLLLSLLLAAPGDEAFLRERIRELEKRYADVARQQSAGGIRARAAVVRELAHLPFGDSTRPRAGKLLARIVSEDRSYRVRADAAVAIGVVGTEAGLAAMYASLEAPSMIQP